MIERWLRRLACSVLGHGRPGPHALDLAHPGRRAEVLACWAAEGAMPLPRWCRRCGERLP